MVVEWITKYVDIWVLLFYLSIAILIYINRKKWQIENKIILIYRTKWGIKTIDKFSEKNKELVKIIGYSAIGIGFIGMLIIIGFFIKGIYELIFIPTAAPVVSPVIPGVKVPGSPIFVPFWYGIIALFIVILIHEFGHGIVARAHGIPIKSTGFVFFGPLPGAFVEPDEKKIQKSDSAKQISIFAAGPFFNAILSAIIFLILLLILNPLLYSMVEPKGITFTSIQPGQPAEIYGLEKDIVYNKINDKELRETTDLINFLSCKSPGDNITLSNENKSVSVILGKNPSGGEKGYLGVTGIKTEYTVKNEKLKIPYEIIFIIANLFEWIFILSLGIGLANLLPLGPVDGGRMLYTALTNIKGEEGKKAWLIISWLTLISLLILLFVPIIKTIIFKV